MVFDGYEWKLKFPQEYGVPCFMKFKASKVPYMKRKTSSARNFHNQSALALPS